MEAGSNSPLNPADKQLLLRIARGAIEWALFNPSAAPRPLTIQIPDSLQRVCGCFVTLWLEGRLRGCIGSVYGAEPLYLEVSQVACKAAFSDPRFPPLAVEELPGVEIEVSLLSPPCRIKTPQELVLGRHGVILRQASCSALFLPEVAPENSWDIDNLLKHLAIKAGLETIDWQRAELYSFETTCFGEAPEGG